MDVPEALAGALGGESTTTAISLGGEDAVVLTPTRTLVYRAEGLLSDEQVLEFPHDVRRLVLEEDRRTVTFHLVYAPDDEQSFRVPKKRLDEVFEALLVAVLEANDVVESDEAIRGVFHFDELVLVVTDRRLVKQVGTAAFDEDCEVIDYDDVTDVDVEEGSVGAQLVVRTTTGSHRIKIGHGPAQRVSERLTDAVRAHHDVDTLDELGADEEDEDDPIEPIASADGIGFIDTGDESEHAAPDASEESAETSADTQEIREVGEERGAGDDDGSHATGRRTANEAEGTDTGGEGASAPETVETPGSGGQTDAIRELTEEVEALSGEVADLAAALDEQSDRLDEQRETFDQLIEELRRGR